MLHAVQENCLVAVFVFFCGVFIGYFAKQNKSNQITFIVTSSQHMCLGEWNSWECAPDSAETINI